MNRLQTLDQRRLEFSGFSQGGELDALPGIISAIGTLFPIAVWPWAVHRLEPLAAPMSIIEAFAALALKQTRPRRPRDVACAPTAVSMAKGAQDTPPTITT